MKKVDRRSFLRLGAVTGLASGLPVKAALASETASANTGSQKAVREYVRLGRTELKVSDISFGSFPLRQGDEQVVHHAIDQGINYLDTAESYGDGTSEEVIGRALKGGLRNEVYLATKIAAGARDSAASMMSRLDACLTRLQTDHVDVFFNHAVNDVDRLKNEEWHKFAEQAKSQGKVRYLGMSGHGGYLIECVDYALDQDMFDVLLLAVNFGEDPRFYERFTRSFDFVANQQGLPLMMAKARQKDVGVIAMKVLRGAKLNDMRPFEKDGYTYSQAAMKWILNHPDVDNLIITMRNRDEVDEFLGASGSREITQYDMELLQTYAKLNDASYCRPACNSCEGSCPYNVAISDVLRHRMYALDYGDVSIAKASYADVENNGSPCLSCDGAPCRDACTYDVPIADLCGPTHQLLS